MPPCSPRAISGVLFLFGCGLLAVDPIAEFVIFRVVAERGNSDYHTLSIVYCVISALTLALGVFCLVGALFTAARKAPAGFPVEPTR